VASLQKKMLLRCRGGYCFEQNMLFREGLRSLGFQVTSLQARVVRGLAIDAPRPALHMVLRVELSEGAFLADAGFGNLAPTTALLVTPMLEQGTPHETMRFIPLGEELTLQAKLSGSWEHIYRVVPHPRFDAEYEIANWYTGTHPDAPYRNNLIAARPVGGGKRLTLFNSRFTVRHADGRAERRMLESQDAFRAVLTNDFGIEVTDATLSSALRAVEGRGARGAPHPFFA
jgi:N-hydroxyarylamine O-acetyltransferase